MRQQSLVLARGLEHRQLSAVTAMITSALEVQSAEWSLGLEPHEPRRPDDQTAVIASCSCSWCTACVERVLLQS